MDARKLIRRAREHGLPGARVAAGADRLGSLLDALAPGMVVQDLQLGDGVCGGLRISDGAVVVCELLPAAPTIVDWPIRLPPLPDLLAAAERGVSVQLLVQMAPSLIPSTENVCAAYRHAYLAVRVPDRVATSASAVVGRLAECLAAAGVLARVLTTDQVVDALGLLTGVDRAVSDSQVPILVREPRVVRVASAVHACFRVEDVAASGTRAYQFLERVSLLPSVALTIAMAAEHLARDTRLETVVRVSADDDAHLARSVQILTAEARMWNVRLSRLDGQHRDAFVATLPLGGYPKPSARWAQVISTRLFPELPITAWVGGAGPTLGTGSEDQRPIPLRLLGPQPLQVLVVGRPLAKFIALRTVAVRAVVSVQTTQPGAWSGPFQLVRDTSAIRRHARSRAGSHLVVIDDDHAPRAAPPPDALPHQPMLLVRRKLQTADIELVRAADAVILQSIDRADTALIAAALGEQAGRATELLSLNQAVILDRNRAHRVTLNPTPYESTLIELTTHE
jgi:hypothetical protein